MAFEFLGIDLSSLRQMGGSQEAATHESAFYRQNSRDIREALLEMAKATRTTQEISQRQLDTQERGKVEKIQAAQSQEFRETLEEFFGKQGIKRPQARDYAEVLSEKVESGEIQDLDKTLDSLSRSFKGLDKNIFDFSRTLISGGAGAAMVAGLVHGQPMAMLGGAFAGMASISSAYNKAKIERELGDEGANPILSAVKQSGVMIASGIATLMQEAFTQSLDRVQKAMNFQEVYEQAQRRGITLTPQGILQTSGRIQTSTGESFRTLTAEQIQQFTQIFAQTGGGTNEQFNRSMDTFTRNLIVFGESANAMLQVSRRLNMWIPDKEFDATIEKYTEKLTKAGIPPELIQQQIQLLSTQSERIGQMNFRDPEKAVNNLLTNSDYISTKLGLPGQVGTTAMEQMNTFVKGSISNPSQFAFLQAAGLSTQEIMRITSGQMKISDLETSKMQSIMTAFRQRTGGLGEDVSAVLASQVFGTEGARLYEAEAYGRVGPRRREVDLPSAREVIERREGLTTVRDKFVSLGVDKYVTGFDENMQQTASAVLSFQQTGAQFVSAVTKLSQSFEMFANSMEKITSFSGMGGVSSETFSKTKPVLPGKPSSGITKTGINSSELVTY